MSAAYRKRLWGLISQSPYNAMSDQACLDAVNNQTETQIVSRRMNERDLLVMFSTLTDGEAFITKLETGAESNAILARALKWFLPSEEGIDVGNSKTRSMLDALVGNFGIVQDEVDTAKAYAEDKVSPAELVGLNTVKLGDIVITRQLYS